METFTNQTIDTTKLPKFEQVAFTRLNSKYWNVVVIQLLITLSIFIGVSLAILYFNEEFKDYIVETLGSLAVIFGIIFFFSRLAFKKKSYAFREHDVLFRSGVIASTTTIIPYNRIQHVALHEGFIDRKYHLAEIQIFTAGGSGSDLEIPGIAIEEAENIKQLLMGKIKKQL